MINWEWKYYLQVTPEVTLKTYAIWLESGRNYYDLLRAPVTA
jgi:hypothetical protein